MDRKENIMQFISKTLIQKGWSKDKKYCATAENGMRYLLRISDIKEYDKKLVEFRMMEQVTALGVPMCAPMEFGTCDEGVYSVQGWIDGKDAEDVIPSLSRTEQYVYGLEAGRILKKIHSIPAPKELIDWETKFNAKLDRKLLAYSECPIKYENGQAFIDYIGENRHLLKGRPQVFQHGDYHIGNMMIDTERELQIIDFNRSDYGDPWEEFNRIVWCAQKAPFFASGMVDGYFDGEVPMEFWRLLALYISGNTLSSVYWAIPFGQGEIDTMLNQAKDVLSWYDNMKNPVPTWYQKDICLQWLDGVHYRMKKDYDFSFLREYGKVFAVYDDQDSGNICFGTEKNSERYFVKFAGAPTARYQGTPKDAIARLKATLPVYRELKHKTLMEFVEAKDIANGFAMVFKWVDGDCMGRAYPLSHKRFMDLPIAARHEVFRDLLNFFVYIASQNYVAIDFYDGSILYDFETGKTTVCDIDFFRKQPTFNDMGRMWGSSRFQAPEEFRRGDALDEVTNVYTLGATAFALFGEYERSRDKWQLNDKLFAIATKAVSAERKDRFASIEELQRSWMRELE